MKQCKKPGVITFEVFLEGHTMVLIVAHKPLTGQFILSLT